MGLRERPARIFGPLFYQMEEKAGKASARVFSLNKNRVLLPEDDFL